MRQQVAAMQESLARSQEECAEYKRKHENGALEVDEAQRAVAPFLHALKTSKEKDSVGKRIMTIIKKQSAKETVKEKRDKKNKKNAQSKNGNAVDESEEEDAQPRFLMGRIHLLLAAEAAATTTKEKETVRLEHVMQWCDILADNGLLHDVPGATAVFGRLAQK